MPVTAPKWIEFIGKKWTLEVSIFGGVITGYATEAKSAHTHKFILYKGKASELFSMSGTAPEKVRKRLSGMMLAFDRAEKWKKVYCPPGEAVFFSSRENNVKTPLWHEVQDHYNCSKRAAKTLARRVMILVRKEAYSTDRAIERVWQESRWDEGVLLPPTKKVLAHQ